jgi:hypothetical protein
MMINFAQLSGINGWLASDGCKPVLPSRDASSQALPFTGHDVGFRLVLIGWLLSLVHALGVGPLILEDDT